MIEPKQVFTGVEIVHGSDTNSYSLNWRVPDDLPYFDGHFPDRPIMPAIAIIDASQVFLESALGETLILRAVVNAKFLAPVEPEQDMQITINQNRVAPDWFFEWTESKRLETVAAIRLRFH